jgi:glutamine amidotransferase
MLDAERPLVGWSEEHGHGWGIGWYEQAGARLEKAPGPAQTSEKFRELSSSVNSHVFVCHLRKATCGEQSACNSQPFRYGNWLFGHNGTVDRDRLLQVIDDDTSSLEGDTDSEVYFRWLIRCFADRGLDGLKAGLEFVRGGEFTALNFVASDGEKLYGYWEKSVTAKTADPDYYQLCCLQVREPTPTLIICSERLDDREWKRIPHRTLIQIEGDLTHRFVEMK